MPDLHRLDIEVNEDDFALAEALVARHATSGWEEESLPTGEIRLRVHCENRDVLDALAAELRALLSFAVLHFGAVAEQNWLEAWRDFFTPVEAGDFFILPPWLAGTRSEGRHAILIEPKSAFGTGHHPTTTLCLEAISRLRAGGSLRPGQTFLDLGTGTGILGLACVKLGLMGLGLDIDPLAVDNARENLALNNISGGFAVEAGSVERAQGRRFDLVIANILAGPLTELARPIMDCVRPGGALILSGFLGVQTPALEAAYAALGAPERLTEPSSAAPAGGRQEDWVCLFWPAKN